jgi:hypothetical protein
MTCAEHFFLFAPARAKMQDCAFIALFAPILLLTLSIMPVLHAVHAVTEAATTGDYFLASSPYDNSHLSITHNRIFKWEEHHGQGLCLCAGIQIFTVNHKFRMRRDLVGC